MFRKNIFFFFIFAVFAANLVFSQSLSYSDNAEHRNAGLILFDDTSVYDNSLKEDRLKTGFLNILFGLGSILHGHDMHGYLIGIIDVAGIFIILGGSNMKWGGHDVYDWNSGRTYKGGGNNIGIDNDFGYIIVGAGVILGFILPFSANYTPMTAKVSQGNFPFNIGLTTGKDGEISGLRVCYNIKY